jgi:hypothetical protein
MSSSETTGDVRLGEVYIGASGTRRADFTGLRDIWPFMARFGLAYARPWRQSWPEELVIRRMSDYSSDILECVFRHCGIGQPRCKYSHRLGGQS